MFAYGGCNGENCNNKEVNKLSILFENSMYYACTMLYNFFDTGRIPAFSYLLNISLELKQL